MVNDLTKKMKERMQKSIEALRKELSKMRTGRASLSILDDVKVEYYGTLTPIAQMASLSIPDPRTIAIQPWDASATQAIERALMKADLGLNPVSDGKVVRLPIPALNEERRKDIVKSMRKHGEEVKVAVRNIRRDINEEIKVLKKDSKITEDDERKGHEAIQKITDEMMKSIDDALAHKEKDVMEV